MNDESTPDLFGDVIHIYSRKEALEDGELIDCSALAREAGIKYPVAMTRAVWDLCVALSPAAEKAGNDEKGRLWDVRWMLSLAIRAARGDVSEIKYQLLCVVDSVEASTLMLKANCGPGDDAEPVITIMLPDED